MDSKPKLAVTGHIFGSKKIQERLPQVEKKLYIFEANEATDLQGWWYN
jgi:hypothetical protein